MKRKGLNIFGIRYKIAICFLVPVLFMIAIGVVSYQIAQFGLSQKYQDSTIQTIRMAKEYIDISCTFVESEGMRLAFDSEVNKYMLGKETDPVEAASTVNRINDSLWSTKSSNPFIQNIHIVTKAPIDILSTGTGSKKAGNLEEYMESVGMFAGSVPKWIDAHTALDTYLEISNPGYLFAYEMIPDGNIGCIVIDIKETAIQEFIDGLELGQGSIVGVVTINGKELISIQADEDSFPVMDETVFADKDFYQAISGESSEGVEVVRYQGIDSLFIYSRSSDVGITVCALVPMRVVTGQAQEIRSITIGFVILAVVIAVIFGLIVTTGIQNNLERISGQFGEVANGNLTVQVYARGRDEFQSLAKSATDMIRNTKKLVNKVSGATGQLEESSKDVEQVSGVITGYAQEITGAINDINDGIQVQMRNAQECVSLTDILSEDIQEVSKVVDDVEKLVDETEALIRHGIEIAEDLGDKAKETTQITAKVSGSISSLKQESEIINSFVETITSISKQTNLLSLNASIEAARAGAAGKGFSVVAEEIRKLADDSAKAASQIQANVTNIEVQTKESVTNADQAKYMVELQSKAVEDAVMVFGSINCQMEKLVDGLKKIAENTSKADSERSDTVQSVKNISASIEVAVESAEIVREIADRLLESVNKLNKTAEGLGNNMEGLKTEISVFRI